MPNWCCNNEYICGPKDEISSLYRKLTEWTEKNYTENGFGEGWLGNIVGFAGFKRSDEIPESQGGLPCRGWITEIDKNNRFMVEFESKGNTGKINFVSETAWIPMPEIWYAVLAKHAPNCSYYYSSEEPNMEIYISNDTEHVCFDEEFIVEKFYEHPKKVNKTIKKHFPESMESACYDFNEDEIRKALQEILQTKETDIDKLIEEYEKNEKALMGNDSYNYLYIHRIRYKKD